VRASHWCRGRRAGRVCSQAFWPVVFGGGWCGRGFQLAFRVLHGNPLSCRDASAHRRRVRRETFQRTCLGVLCCSAAFRAHPHAALVGRCGMPQCCEVRGSGWCPDWPRAAVGLEMMRMSVRQPVAARCQCRPMPRWWWWADPQSWSPGCRVPAAASAVRCRYSPLSLACLGRIRIVACHVAVHCDMRASGPPASVRPLSVVGRRLMRLPALVWVDSG
jgi:hypothetical protein